MKYIYIFFFIMALGAVSCTEGFEEINTNPNSPIEVETEFLLRQVIYDYGEQMSYEGFVAGNLLGQYFTAVDFNLFDRHSLSEPQFGGNPWPILYTNLRDNELVLQKALTNETDRVYEGPARIMKAYLMAALTDIFGDVPYTEALQGKSGNVTPAYDTQEAIYTGEEGILAQLDKGIAAIENYEGVIGLSGDVFYDGDLDAWVRFANSLKLKYLIRINDQIDGSVAFFNVFSSQPYILDNTQNATFDFTNSPPNNFRMSTARIGDFNLFILSETMQEVLSDLNDSRLATYFRPTENDPTSYNGLLNGPDASTTSISIADYSLAGTIFRENTGALKANFMTAWETQFLIAEAAHKGLIFANPKNHYEEGVRLAFEYWNTPMPEGYLTAGPAAYDAAEPMEQIITQKWIAQINNGYEGWIEYRRTGYPALKTIAASLNNDLIPVRMPYPTDEEALNAANFNVASDKTNGNSVNVGVWWDE